MVRILMCLPGFGEERALACVNRFGSARAVLETLMARDYKAFADVAGVGKGLVNKAADMLEKEVG